MVIFHSYVNVYQMVGDENFSDHLQINTTIIHLGSMLYNQHIACQFTVYGCTDTHVYSLYSGGPKDLFLCHVSRVLGCYMDYLKHNFRLFYIYIIYIYCESAMQGPQDRIGEEWS